MREIIANQAIKLFFTSGIKSVTMSDVAQSLGISKKTLYQIFEDKDDLLQEGLRHKHLNEQLFIGDGGKNLLDSLFDCSHNITRLGTTTNIRSIIDLRRYHPEVYRMAQNHIISYINCCAEKVPHAIAKGYIEPSITVEFVRNYLEYIIFNLFASYQDKEQYSHHIALSVLIFAKGIASAKGERYIKRLNKA